MCDVGVGDCYLRRLGDNLQKNDWESGREKRNKYWRRDCQVMGERSKHKNRFKYRTFRCLFRGREKMEVCEFLSLGATVGSRKSFSFG